MKSLVIGAGKSGKSAIKLLKKLGYTTFLIDDKKTCLTEHLKEKLLKDLDLVVVSPGVPLDNSFVQEISNKGIEIIGEFELGARLLRCKSIAITGTNGKTTTTSLVGHILSESGESTFVGGNIGVPVSSFCLQTKNDDVSVLEVSSFQLESSPLFRPHIAAILNITPDHLNRHKTMENYIKAKLNIFKNQTYKDYAVINLDDEILSQQDFSFVKSEIYYFSTKVECKGCYVKNGCIYFNDGVVSQFVMRTADISLKGEHNLSNVLAGLLCVILYGLPLAGLSGFVKSFQGVSHRLEFVAEINGVSFINDSKATNISSTLVAMKAMTEHTTVILGGSDKGCEFDELFESVPVLIKNFVVIGETKQKILAAAARKNVSNVYACQTFKEAINFAYELSESGECVLLSPACASFDMFSNFEERGKAFSKFVKELEKSENRKISNKEGKKTAKG